MIRWKFEITNVAQNDLHKIDAIVRDRVVVKLKWFAQNFDYITPIPLGEPFKGFFKLRIGDWRVIYEIENNRCLITVHVIDRRDNVYKKLRNIYKR